MTQGELFRLNVLIPEDQDTKVCIWCNKSKGVSFFAYYGRNADKRDNRCRQCVTHNKRVTDNLKANAPDKPEVCECCRKVPKPKVNAWGKCKSDFVLDHCHDTETFRGWLCDHCNLAIGLLGDNILGVKKALDYLERVTKENK